MKKVALIFPGQGSQYVGMGKGFYDKYSVVRETFEEANDIIGFDIKKLCFEGSLGKLSLTENALPAIFITSVAAFRVYMQEIGVVPHVSAGHSLGEYSALTCSGAIEFCDALKIVRKRSLLAKDIAEKNLGAMTIIDGIDKYIVDEECKAVSIGEEKVIVSCYNSYEQVAISGHKNAVWSLEDRLLEMNANVTPLIMSAPFHCSLMEPAEKELRKELEKYTFNSLKWPVISNVIGRPFNCKEPDSIINNLAAQISNPVRWHDIIHNLKKSGIKTFVEIGPQGILTNLINSSETNINAFSFTQDDDREELRKFLSDEIKYNDSKIVEKCMSIAVGTQNYNNDNEQYNLGVIKQYKRLEAMLELYKTNNEGLNLEQKRESIEILSVILKTKKIPIRDQKDIIKQLLVEINTCQSNGKFLV